MTTNKKGFSIIEVVLVLAIAGLIFLMVFIALPALQRNQRDSARKNDASTVVSALNTYRSNNRSSFGTPGNAANGITSTKIQSYIDRLDQYEVDQVTIRSGTGAETVTANEGTIQVKIGAKCPTSLPAPGTMAVALSAGTSRSAAVVTALENNGSQKVVYCQDA